MTTSNTRGYWIRTIRGWGEDRLSDPQYAELDAVITWYEDSAGERDELKDENAKLRAELAEAIKHLRKCTDLYALPAQRMRAQDEAGAWLAKLEDIDHD